LIEVIMYVEDRSDVRLYELFLFLKVKRLSPLF